MNKKGIIGLFLLGSLTIVIGIFLLVFTDKRSTPTDNLESQELLPKIVTNFNAKEVALYVNDEKEEIKAELVDTNTIAIVYTFGYANNRLLLKLEGNILSSEDYLESVIAMELIDSILALKNEGASFFTVFETNTVSDYQLSEDGIEIEQLKGRNRYKIKIDLTKEIMGKDYTNSIITMEDYQGESLKANWADNTSTYFLKGSILYQEETDQQGNKVVTFAQEEPIKENLRESIANYIETYGTHELKEDFLESTTLANLTEPSTITKENYTLEKDYLVFSSQEVNPYFEDYFENNYKVVVLILKPNNQ